MAKNKVKVIRPIGNWHSYSNYIETDVITIASVGIKDLNKFNQQRAYVWDIRKSVRNPYAITGLRKLTGLDEPVKKFLLSCPNTNNTVEFITCYSPTQDYHYKNLIIACTGGKHRSPAIAEMVAEKMRIKYPNIPIVVEHWSLKQDD